MGNRLLVNLEILVFSSTFLGLYVIAGNGVIKGSIKGITTSTTPQKLWLVCQALGDIAFSYPYSIIFIEIQDTLKSSPPENETMKKASFVSICITTFFYLCCGGFGYAAFGDQTPGNLLTGFGFYEPYWLIDFANACIVLHLVGGYQVYCRPVFAAVDKWCANKFPNSGLVNINYALQLPFLPVLRLNLLRLCLRCINHRDSNALSLLQPGFGSVGSYKLLALVNIEMYLLQRNIGSWTNEWITFQTFSIVCLLITMIAFNCWFI